MNNIIFLFIAFFSEIIGTIVGFGSSTLALPLSLLFFDFQTALVLVAFLHIFGNIGRITFFKHGIDREVLLKFGIPSVLFSLLGAGLVTFISQDILKMILGIFLVFYALFSFREDLKLKANTFTSIIGGSFSGFLAGLIGTGGALRAAFLTSFGLIKEKYIATTAAIALLVDITRLPIYLSQGLLEKKFFIFIPFIFVVAFVGSFIGKLRVSKTPQQKFRNTVLVAILLIGLKFIYDWFV